MRDKTFILGVGCQKGGTSWLHAQLENCPHVDMGFTKEYHVFDTLYVNESRRRLGNKLQELAEIIQSSEKIPPEHHPLFKLMTFYLEPRNYYDYFDYLWYRGGVELTAVGDITPSYSAVPIEGFQEIKTNLEARGFTVKVIFLMRDPIERCWSMVRMRREDEPIPIENGVALPEQKHLRQVYRSKQCQNRTRYEVTIQNLESVFSPDNIFYGFYETLFEESTLNRLKVFLALPDFTPDVEFKIKVSKKSGQPLNEGLARKIFEFYKETYQFCDIRFGTKEIWSGW